MEPTSTKPVASELDQAAADRRTFGNSSLAANAEFRVIAEALRELVTELRMIRTHLDKWADTTSRGGSAPGHRSGGLANEKPDSVR